MKKMKSWFSQLWFMGLITLIGFPLLAWPILYFQDIPFFSIFKVEFEEAFLIPAFIAFGILFGLISIWYTEHPYFEKELSNISNRLDGVKINRWNAFYISVCAGVGEEVFFRAALQPLLGIWVCSFVFVAIHLYFSFKSWKINLFGIALTLFIVVLGWGFETFSLWHAIAGHFAYDFVLLNYMRKTN
jgi:hypothetical protein